MAKKPTYDELEQKVRELEKEVIVCKEAKKALKGLFNGILSALHETLIVVFDQEGNHNFVWGDTRLDKRYGVKITEAEGMNLRDILPLEDANRKIDQIKNIFDTGESFRDEYKIRFPQGEFLHDISLSPLQNTSGEVTGVVGFIRDISERKWAEERLKESEERYRSLVFELNDGIFVTDNKGGITFANRTLVEMYGYENPEEFLGKNFLELISHEQRDEFSERFSKAVRSGQFSGDIIDVSTIRKDGRAISIQLKSGPVKEKGAIVGTKGIIRDVTHLKRTEAALRDSEEKYHSLLEDVVDSSGVGLFILDSDFKVVWLNQSLELYFGLEREEIIGKDKRQLILEQIKYKFEDPKGFAERLLATYDNNTYVEIFECHVLPDGQRKERWLEHRSRPIRSGLYTGGRVELYYDISDRKRVEDALLASEERFRAIFEQAAVGVGQFETETGRIIRVNQRYCEIIGYTQQEMTETTLMEITHPDDVKQSLDNIQRLIKGEIRDSTFEKRYVRKDGSVIWINLTISPMWSVGEKPNYHIGIVEDITRRKQVEEALQESEERFRSLFEQAAEAIFVHDLNGHIKDVNHVACEIWGYDKSEFLDLCIEDIDPDASERGDKKYFWDQLEEKAPIAFETQNRRKDGSLFPIEVSLSPIQFGGQRLILGIARDISERMQAEKEKARLENQLQQANKMEAIATLAGGVAHEFNNALMGIVGNIELLKMDLPEDEGRDKYFGAMKGSSHRMSRLTDQLLAYAKGGKYQPKNLKLDDFVIETLPILQHNLSPAVRVETHFPTVSYIKADNAQMQMVLSAILANSNEAIEDEGCIRITAENKDIDEDFTKQHSGLKPGYYVCLTIEDNGMGMDEETRNGIFGPFFTTKFQGRGMGMAAVYGIVKNHDGWISVDSDLGKGTTVRIYLPAIEIEEEKPTKAEVEAVKGSGTILMIEDEDVVIEVTQAMLEMLGYRVMVAKTGKDAIHITETFDGQMDLALLDIKLPDMEGGKVYPLIMKARPDLKVIVFSGYSIDGPARKILDAGAQDFIQKPFSLTTLSEKLKKVLGGK